MNVTEDKFIQWSKGPFDTEAAKCEHAETAIKKAIKASSQLSNLDITVFSQGSYRARTNVRQNSDVDICVRYNSTFFTDYPEGKTHEDFGNTSGSMSFADFKQMLHKALVNYFGNNGVTRGNKAFDVHANTYRIDADVVPTFEYRWYSGQLNPNGTHHYHSGVAFDPDQGRRIINWPQQTYDNGVLRNTDTRRRFKRTIRILKHLRDKMQSDKIPEAGSIPSFLIECLVWNADTSAFTLDTHTATLRHLISNLWSRTRQDENCNEWGEVNELKYLFRPSQPWSRQQVNSFLVAAWNYIGFR